MDPQTWLSSYPEGIASTIDPDQYNNLLEVLDESVQKFGDKTAYTHRLGNNEQRLSYRELDEASRAFAAFLQHFTELQPGDRFAIQLPNCLQYPVALFGSLRAGLVVVNTNPLYTSHEMEHQFADAGVKGLLILDHFADKLEPVLPLVGIETLILTGIGDAFPWPKGTLINAVAKHVKGMVPPHEILQPVVRYKEVLKAGRTRKYEPVAIQNDQLAFLQYTGGTTGVSKGAELTHRNIIANLEQVNAWLGPFLKEREEVLITALPMYHVFALTINSLVFLRLGCDNLLVTNPRNIGEFLEILSHYKPSVMTGVNTLFNAMMNHPDFQQVDWSQMKMSVGGAMALQRAVVEEWQKQTDSKLIEGYGLTEASPVVTVNPLDATDRIGTIGLPLPSTEVKLVTEDGAEVTEANQPGELWVKGPQVMRGYWNRPEESANVLMDNGEWLRTGDIAEWRGDGFLAIVDRLKDMINVSGFNVYPNEVEDALASHPGILEVAAIGVQDEHSNEAVKVIVVPKDPTLTVDMVRDYARRELTGYKVPKHVEFRQTELPKSNVGKILRRALREESQAAEAGAH